MKDRLWNYIWKWQKFYRYFPYSVDHFYRKIVQLKIAISDKAVRQILDALCKENKLIKIGGEYMIHPSIGKNNVYVEAWKRNGRINNKGSDAE